MISPAEAIRWSLTARSTARSASAPGAISHVPTPARTVVVPRTASLASAAARTARTREAPRSGGADHGRPRPGPASGGAHGASTTLEHGANSFERAVRPARDLAHDGGGHERSARGDRPLDERRATMQAEARALGARLSASRTCKRLGSDAVRDVGLLRFPWLVLVLGAVGLFRVLGCALELVLLGLLGDFVRLCLRVGLIFVGVDQILEGADLVVVLGRGGGDRVVGGGFVAGLRGGVRG